MTTTSIAPSALISAIRANDPTGVKSALDNGADIEEADLHGVAGLPLRTACFGGNAEIVLELLERGANANARGSDGPNAPLRLAARVGHTHIAELLIKKGAQIPPGYLRTPLLPETEPNAEGSAETPVFVFQENWPSKENRKAPADLPPLEFHTSAQRFEHPEATRPTGTMEMQSTQPIAAAFEGQLIADADASANCGTDTTLLGLDLLHMSEETDETRNPPPAHC